MAAVLAALLLCFFHLVDHLIKKPLIQIQNNHKSKIHLSGNLVEVLLHGDCGLGSAKEEQEEEEDRVTTLHLGILGSTTSPRDGLRRTDADADSNGNVFVTIVLIVFVNLCLLYL